MMIVRRRVFHYIPLFKDKRGDSISISGENYEF